MRGEPQRTYLDPLDAIWLTVASRIGFRVERSNEVFASTDGEGLLVIGAPATLDPDDCLAQMIFHELCHSLVEGARSLVLPDFGLDNQSDRDDLREHACLRVQAALSSAHGLRAALAPTTEFRAYYDALEEDPLRGEDRAARLARGGTARAEVPPWAPHLHRGLAATAQVVRALRELGASDPGDPNPPIWA